jgi:hypothetical protein
MLAVSEALFLATAAQHRDESLASMELLNELRHDIVDEPFEEPASIRPLEWLRATDKRRSGSGQQGPGRSHG